VGGITQQINAMQYNELSQLKEKYLHGNSGSYMQKQSFAYNIRGWLTDINSLGTSSTGAFAQKIYYNEVPSYMAGKATARYNGNIQAIEWRNQGITQAGFASGYVFSYDKLNRLTKALFMKRNLGNGSVIWDQSVAASKYNYGLVTSVGTVRGINYDKNGNIKTLSRLARRSSDTDIVVFDSLSYTYDGNRLKNVSDAISGQNDLKDFPGGGFQGAETFFYDSNGNMNSDNVRGIQLTYNHMNMPLTILSNEGHIENTYSWDGSKRRRRVLDQYQQLQSDERYFGDLVTENGLPSLILHADGYVDVSVIQPLFTYHLKDHLGNVRIVMQAGGSSGNLKQTNDYYPFGMAFTKNAADSEEESFARENKYKYNGKEEQPMPGKWLDYGKQFGFMMRRLGVVSQFDSPAPGPADAVALAIAGSTFITAAAVYVGYNIYQFAQHGNHSDSIFVSDLIEFSTYWGLSIPYEKCLSFLERWGDDDDYLALSSIDYILENLRYSYIDEIYKLLYSILHNPESNQSTQVKSAFALLRITGRKVFLTDLIDLVVNGNANNKLLLNNILSLKYNSSLYFDYYDILKSMMPYPESNKNIIDPIE
jgi:hypothetical protein